MSTAARPAARPQPRGPVAAAARWLTAYSDAAAGIAKWLMIASIVLCAGSTGVNVFTSHVLGFGTTGYDELAAYTYLWVIWMGASLAVRRGEVTVITILRDRGPAWWRLAVRTFSGVSLAALLGVCVVRSTQYALVPTLGTSALLSLPKFYGVASMTLGYYFITLHYLAAAARAAARLSGRRREATRTVVTGVVGGAVLAVIVGGLMRLILDAGVSPLFALAILFVALTFAGNPIIFMLSIVGIVAASGIAGMTFYPSPDPLFAFETTQTTMGLNGYSELIVILTFLIVAEVINASGMSDRLIAFAATLVGHLRGGMAYVCQATSAIISGMSGSATADAAIMTPLLVPAMEKEGYPKDVAAAVVAGASIKGPIGPISIMFIVYGTLVVDTHFRDLLLSGILAEILLLVFQMATVYLVVRRIGFFTTRPFAGWRAVEERGLAAAPVLLIPVIVIGGIVSGVFAPSESGAAAAGVTLLLAMFWYRTVGPRDLPRILTAAGIETGIVMLLVGDSSIVGTALGNHGFGADLSGFLTGLTDNRYVFLLLVNAFLLLIGIFVEPLPALYIFVPFLWPVADHFHINPTQFGLIVVFNLVLALIHPPVGLVLFLVSSLSKVSVERLSIVILPWLGVSLAVLFLVTYLPPGVVLVLVNHTGTVTKVLGLLIGLLLVARGLYVLRRRLRPSPST